MKHFKYELLHINTIKPYECNPRKHNTKQIKQIMDSIQHFGFTNPLLIDEKHILIAGHGRLEAVKQLNKTLKNKIELLPCIIINNLSEADKKALIIADNQLALNADWDYELLKKEIEDLKEWNFNIDLLGFENELDTLDFDKENERNCDVIDNTNEIEAIIKLGDIIEIGKHKFMCGDSTKRENWDILMNVKRADCVMTSPPYNNSHNGGLSFNKYKNGIIRKQFYLDKNSDNKTEKEYHNFCIAVLQNINHFLQDKHTILWNVAYNSNSRDSYGKILFYSDNPFSIMDTLIWDKKSCNIFQNARILGRRCEFVFAMSKTLDSYLTNFYCNTNYIPIDLTHTKTHSNIHAAMYPIELVEYLLPLFLQKQSLVLDPFLGTGTTLLACELQNHTCYGMELEPLYCQTIIDRYRELTNKKDIVINGKPI